MSNSTPGAGIINMINEVGAHATKYKQEAADLTVLAKLAAEHDNFDLEHRYLNEARMKCICALLVEKAAEKMRERAVIAATTVLNHFR